MICLRLAYDTQYFYLSMLRSCGRVISVANEVVEKNSMHFGDKSI